MSDIVTFLRQRLDEEANRAEAARVEWDSDWQRAEFEDLSEDAYAHVQHLDPARVLAEVDARRRIIDWCVEVISDRDMTRYGEFGFLRHDKQALAVTLAVETLRLLALPYAGHPDYRDEWRPGGEPDDPEWNITYPLDDGFGS